MGQQTGLTDTTDTSPVVLGIDGGNSKVDIALADASGQLLGALRGGTISHQAIGLEPGMNRLSLLAALLATAAGRSPLNADIVVATLAGADYREDIRMLERAIERLELGHEVVVLNDTFGALRAGASSEWGVALVCGQGINAAAVAPNGRQLRFAGVGDISGDWGGGGGIAMAAIKAAVRGSDGRGPRTSLERAVPRFFGTANPAAMTRAFYFGHIPEARISRLAPVVFETAASGDAVARAIIDRLADELAGMAGALIRRLHLTRLDVEVVLAGGVFRTRDEPFYERLYGGVWGAAPHAKFVHLDSPPVAGAVLLALDELTRRGARPRLSLAESDSLRRALGDWDRRALGTTASGK